MLHRLALRVLPQLQAAVTEQDVRKRKRLVMLVPGLLAFLFYRLLKHTVPFDHPFTLLAFSGMFCMPTALWAYRMGRRERFVRIWQKEPFNRLSWLVLWIGGMYGIQLSLLVLALLALFVDYNFLIHPDGPAMMALIISSTAVTRDAFEIGHVVRVQNEGTPLVTFPDGQPLRELLQRNPLPLFQWMGLGLMVGGVFSLGFGLFWGWGLNGIGQAVFAMIVAGSLGFCSFLFGKYPDQTWLRRLESQTWWERVQFWIWPCLTFALTYYLVLWGIAVFLLDLERTHPAFSLALGAVASALMGGYSFYLGTRVFVEMQIQGGMSEGLRRCPFVMEILAKTGWVSPSDVPAPSSIPSAPAKRTS